jgi:hypothetical protein
MLLCGALLEMSAVVTPFSTEVPVTLSEKSGFCVILRFTGYELEAAIEAFNEAHPKEK